MIVVQNILIAIIMGLTIILSAGMSILRFWCVRQIIRDSVTENGHIGFWGLFGASFQFIPASCCVFISMGLVYECVKAVYAFIGTLH